jgi:3-hydroxybutyryl-CoA dehydrogenase
MTAPLAIAALGAGRMGRGIAVVFAFAGHDVALVDAKPRDPAAFATLAAEVAAEIRGTLGMMARIGLMQPDDVAPLAARIRTVPYHEADPALATAAIVFEGVPEVLAVKLAALTWASKVAAPDAIIASTTSTILVDELSPAVQHPGRFLNAHWLNPAFLMPLVEMQPGAQTDPAVTARLTALLEAMGKVPVTCAARPGYIVPRIQMLAMNEAARMVEEGVATAADIDRAVRYGFGFRFAVLGLLEFIDWGGGDILHYASEYLTKALNHPRYEAPPVIARNMAEGHIGMKTGRGFLDYTGVDLDAYREGRLSAFADLLRGMGLAREPVLTTEKSPSS